MKVRLIFAAMLVLALVLGGLRYGLAAWGVITSRISLTALGQEVNGNSTAAVFSSNGRFVTYTSHATDLVAGDTNSSADVFVVDLDTHAVCLASQTSDGTIGNTTSNGVSVLSADGRYVAYASLATNLLPVPFDTNGYYDVYLHDCQTGATERISEGEGHTQGNNASGSPSISADGRYVAFDSYSNNFANGDVNGTWDIFVRDRQTLHTYIVSMSTNGLIGNSYSSRPAISANGNRVAFFSSATNLVTDDTNNAPDLFVRDREAGTTIRASVRSDGFQANNGIGTQWTPWISDDGNLVVFYSSSTNLVDNDTNVKDDIFVKNLTTGAVIRASVDSSGVQANGHSNHPVISPDGRYVAFESLATNLVANDANGKRDIFVHDLQTHETFLASARSDGVQGNADSFWPAVVAAGGVLKVAYDTASTNLVTDDTNGKSDVFLSLPGPAQDKKSFLPVVVKAP